MVNECIAYAEWLDKRKVTGTQRGESYASGDINLVFVLHYHNSIISFKVAQPYLK